MRAYDVLIKQNTIRNFKVKDDLSVDFKKF